MTEKKPTDGHSDQEEGSVIRGSGNVFADAGLPDAEELLLKAQLALMLAKTIRGRGLSQRKAAEITGLPQPDISAIVNGRLVGFSPLRLMKALRSLGKSIELHIKDDEGEDLVLAV